MAQWLKVLSSDIAHDSWSATRVHTITCKSSLEDLRLLWSLLGPACTWYTNTHTGSHLHT